MKPNPIILALDVPAAEPALALVRQLRDLVGLFKIGSELFTRAGPALVREVRALGAPVFLDLKFHDIPNTVAKAVEAARSLDVQMFTVHTGGGRAMMQAAQAAATQAASPARPAPLVLGVTVLTSLDAPALEETGVLGSVEAHVERLARLAVEAGLRGLVCSPLELPRLRRLLPAGTTLVTPGIRGPGHAPGDQKRTLAPADALAAGADWLVVGRPIYAAADPRAAAEAILASLSLG